MHSWYKFMSSTIVAFIRVILVSKLMLETVSPLQFTNEWFENKYASAIVTICPFIYLFTAVHGAHDYIALQISAKTGILSSVYICTNDII